MVRLARLPCLVALMTIALPAAAQEAPDPCAIGDGTAPGTTAFARQSASRQQTIDARRRGLCRAAMPYAGRPLYRSDVQCEVDVCTDPDRRAVLLRVAGLDRDRTLDPRAVGDAWFRLQRTGYFRDVEVVIEDATVPELPEGEEPDPDEPPSPPPPPGAVQVRFVATGHVIITDLDIEYVGWDSRFYPQLFRSEIRKRLPLRRGGSFPPQTADGTFEPDDLRRVMDWQSRVVSLYEQLGFVGTTARIVPKYHGYRNQFVRVVVRVDEGRQPEIGQVLVKGNTAFPYWRIVQPLTTGERIDTLRGLFEIFGVGRYARRELKDELETVETDYRDEGFVTARVRLESPFAEREGRVYPRVRVFEGPRLMVRFEGNESIADEQLAELLTFAENGAVDETEMESSRLAIVDAYQAIARFDVRVDARVESRSPDKVEVVFDIEEGGRIYVRRIEIVGNRQLDDAELAEVMETQGIAPDGIINALATSAGVLQDGRLINDLLAVRQLYRDRGFSGIRFRCGDPARVTSAERSALAAAAMAPEAEMGPAMGPVMNRLYDVWTDDPVNHICYEVLPDPDPRLVVLRIELSEGQRTTVRRLAIDPILQGFGDEARDEAYDLLRELGFVDELLRWRVAGLNRRKLDAVRGFLLRQWHQQGYIDAKVDVVCPPGPELPGDPLPIDGSCNDESLYGLRVSALDVNNTLGPRTLVDGILLQGNLRTDDDVIEAELLFEDRGPLGTDQLFRSQANLRSLGVFDAVQMETISDTRRPGDRTDQQEAAVIIAVEESDYQFADLFVGLQIDSTPIDEELPVLYSLGGSIRDRNLFGRALEVGAGLNFVNRLFDRPLSIDAHDETVFEAGPFLKDRRLFGTRLDLTVEATYKRGRTSQRDAYEQLVDFRPTIGYDFYNLSYPSDWGRGLRATLVTDYRIEQRRALVRNDEVPLFGSATQSITLEPTLTWDRRDSPLHPTRDGVLLASVEVVFNAFSTLEELLQPSFKESITAQYVQSFFDRQLIMVPTLRLGAVQTDQEEADLKSGFFFKAGGDGVALPVRGYADAVIEACRGECDDAVDEATGEPLKVGGKAMILGSLEARFPTFILDDFWWTVFSDVGAVSPGWGSMGLDRFYPSLGAGVRWLITGQIPLRLDLAWPLREDEFEDQALRVHLNIFYPL